MPNPFLAVINSILPEPQASLLCGILFGVKASMPKYFYDALAATGTLHIIALSGMNISILATLTAETTLFMGRKASSILTICLIVLFVLFVGPSPSIVRAALMGSLSLLAVYFGKRSWGLLSLLLVCGIMLLFDFSLVKNLSFQLSFLATFGIILANRKVKRQIKKGLINKLFFWLKENLKVTLSAQVFTLPIVLYNFHKISLIAPVANLLLQWVIAPITVIGFITAIMGWIFYPLGLVFGWVVWVPLTYFITVIEILAKVPLASISF